MFSRLLHLHQSFIVCFISVSLLKVSALALAPPPQGSLSLEWDPSTDPTVMGYRLYLGGASQVYTNIIEVGNQTSVLVSELVPGATYFFAVTAYDVTGLESAFSGEIAYIVPIDPNPPAYSSLCWATKRDPLGRMVITGTGPAGRIYEVWATQDFLSWLMIGRVIVDAAGALQFTDPLSIVIPRRFYQLRQPPS